MLQAILFASCLCVCFSSCKDEKEKGAVYDPSRPITLTAFQPNQGGMLTRMLLDGDNFGTDPSKIKVYFNQKQAVVISSNGSRIYALAPRLPGDTCTVSVVVGNDSVSYDADFLYHSIATVSTITGNGGLEFNAGTLAEGMVNARYLCVDSENNIFASVRDASMSVFARINESKNLVEALSLNDFRGSDPIYGTTQLTPNVACVDPATDVVYVSMDNNTGFYASFDPRESWFMRLHKFKMSQSLAELITTNARCNAVALCALDSCLYMRYSTGPLIKVHLDTEEAELVCITPSGLAHYGLVFHPIKKHLLYFSFMRSSGSGAVAGHMEGVSVLDITKADEGLKKLNRSELSGYRDGPVEGAMFNIIMQIDFDADGNLFIVDSYNHCIRMLSNDGFVTTVVGRPTVSGMVDGGKDVALFNMPRGIAVGKDGSIYISDQGNARIRKLVIE